MQNILYKAFVEAGLIQFGYFDGAPLKMSLELLPSYPDILAHLAEEALQPIQAINPERLVSTLGALPLTTLISHKTQLPIVYSLGTSESPVHDLVGAYDVGHPSILLDLEWQGEIKTTAFMQRAESVGLNIQGVITVLSIRPKPLRGIRVIPLVDLHDFLDSIEQSGMIPRGQASAVRQWVSQQIPG